LKFIEPGGSRSPKSLAKEVGLPLLGNFMAQ